MMFLKKIDSITATLLFFVLFIIALFGYLTELNNNIQKFAVNNDKANELKVTNKEFNNFLLRQAAFINYDEINRLMKKFESNLDFLAADKSNMHEYSLLLKNILVHYRTKVKHIEDFKSLNAQLLYSMHYTFELNKAITESTTVDTLTRESTNSTLVHLMRYYINPVLDPSSIEMSLKKLDLTDEESVKMFVNHIRVNLARIKKFNQLQKNYDEDMLFSSISKFDEFLHEDHHYNSLIKRSIVIVLFTLALLILILLIFMNKNAAKLKDELIAFKTAIENSYNSIVMTDKNSDIIYVNDRVVAETGYSKSELIGSNPRVLKSGMNDRGFYKKMHETLLSGQKWNGEFINKRKNGSIFYEKASIMPIKHDGEVVNYLAIKLNITDYIEEKNKVEYIAYHDTLTSLPNRLNIEKYLKKRLPIAQRTNSKIAILFIDLDRFKTINDTLGHDVGDELLIEASKRIKGALRESDVLARVGGDEFVIVVEFPPNDYSPAHICKKLLNLFTQPIQTKSHLLNITLSIGISIYPDDEDNDSLKLFKYADIAMYEAKDSGKNTYKYYQKQLSVNAHNRLNMEQALKVALEKSELFMVYQPQYNLSDRSVIGVEALVRWENPNLGFVPPDQFIPIAEDTGFIISIGLFIFEQSCRDFLEFKKLAPSLETISINISVVQLYQDTFIKEILAITQKVGISRENIRIEITETHIMKNIEQSMEILLELKNLGFSMSIDDFGTGHSSLNYLKRFPINELKIDKSFVDELPHDKNDVAITKAIIALSSEMSYVNVAEGIENAVQEDFLRENGCTIGQGYYFSKPKTKENIINFLQELN